MVVRGNMSRTPKRIGVYRVVGLVSMMVVIAHSSGSRVDAWGVDASFGARGIVRPTGSTETLPAVVDMIGLADGGVITVGYGGQPAMEDRVVLAAFRANGTPNPAFGGSGRVELGRPGANLWARRIGSPSDGRVLVAGETSDARTGARDVFVASVTSTGLLDRAFGAQGFATFDTGDNEEDLTDFIVLADGSALVAGMTWRPDAFYAAHPERRPGPEVFVAHFGPGGVLDPSFGVGGIAYPVVDGTGLAVPRLVVASDASIYVIGSGVGVDVTMDDGARRRDIVALRLAPDGEVDRSFGRQGAAVVGIHDQSATAVSVEGAVQHRDGSLFVIGQTESDGDGAAPFTPRVVTAVIGVDGSPADGGLGTLNFVDVPGAGIGDLIDLAGVDATDAGALVAGARLIFDDDRPEQMRVLVFSPRGHLDGRFGGGGVIDPGSGTSGGAIGSVEIGADGVVYAGGVSGGGGEVGFIVRIARR